jgi:RND family efflux transporter MFP subunit
MSTNVDLRQLAVRREGPAAALLHRRRHLTARYLVPALVLLGFLAVVGWAARDSLLPARPVTVVPVLTSRAEVRQEGTPLFQAAGWIEPRPTPVLVTALAEGVVDKLLVVEGQEVRAGETVATLIDTDARIALRTAESELAHRAAEGDAALAEVEVLLAQKQTDLADVPFNQRIAEARKLLARWNLENRTKASGSVPDYSIREAQREWDTAQAAVDQLNTRAIQLKREVETLTARRDTTLRATKARLDQARVAVDAARLRLERMVVPATITGRVFALVARPGTRLMGLAPGSMHDSSTVVSLYNPARLQVRADVRLEDVPHVQVGQIVKIETAAAPGGPLEGEVIAVTSQADIQKNTLQVKVAVKDPPPTLRPDMLVQVTFLAPRETKSGDAASEPLRLFIPRQLVDTAAGDTRVWLADRAAGVARLQTIKLGLASGDLVEVTEGLNAADRIIAAGREGLHDSQRIAITGEESTSGPALPRSTVRPGRLPGDGTHRVNH